MSIHEFVKNTLSRVHLFTEVSFVCLIILWCLCVEKPSRMEYDIDYVPSIFTHNTKSEASTTHSKLCRYKRLISRRSKALTMKKKLSSKSKDIQLFVFDSSDVQQIVVINCDSDSVNGDITQEQLVAIDCTDTGILNERSGDPAFDHSYANFNISEPADATQDFN